MMFNDFLVIIANLPKEVQKLFNRWPFERVV